jgi:endo-1,4-beta-xylanase
MRTAFTEVDVRMVLPADAEKFTRQAGYFRGLLDACLSTRSCTSFTVWGYTDKHSWVSGAFTGQGAATLMDEDFATKPAYAAVGDRLASGR